MRIGILTSVHPPNDTRIYFKQARSLSRAGHEVFLIAREGGAIDDITYIRLRSPGSRRARLITCFQIVRHAVRLRCDAYHIHDPELLPFGVLIRLLTGAHLVYDAHENVRKQIRNKYWIPRLLRGPVAAAYGAVERLCMRWVSQVVLAVETYREYYDESKLAIIHNYPMLPPQALSSRPRSYSGNPRLVYCGLVAELRGAMEMLEATALLRQRFPAVELHIIGEFVPSELEHIMRVRIEELGITHNVHLYGRLPLNDALARVAECDIGLALLHPDPNYVEALPTKMFEYMSLRLPVLVSSFPIWKEIVDEAHCGLSVAPQDLAAIVRAIEWLNEEPERLRHLGEQGRRAVLNRYSWSSEEPRLLEIYQRLEAAATHPRAHTASPVTRRPSPTRPAAQGEAETRALVGAGTPESNTGGST